ncbi:hypothetical protein JOD55_000484 [Arcanobacterium pluranimalium]|uniref:hypothetical protein n=1 Tax=Arcanobacterium pluranimalium TaxID=108028 RepID=UPI0019571888|nr:hypothetical protein [Arcanobacterium pluranimalium]MBM7824657.1 hypothetical protein [Arcanobacterium pluranimalium]
MSKTSKPKPKRVVRLSRVDQERLLRGEISTPEEAVHIHDAPPVRPAMSTQQNGNQNRGTHGGAGQANTSLSPHERELLENLPPHFGKI